MTNTRLLSNKMDELVAVIGVKKTVGNCSFMLITNMWLHYQMHCLLNIEFVVLRYQPFYKLWEFTLTGVRAVLHC